MEEGNKKKLNKSPAECQEFQDGSAPGMSGGGKKNEFSAEIWLFLGPKSPQIQWEWKSMESSWNFTFLQKEFLGDFELWLLFLVPIPSPFPAPNFQAGSQISSLSVENPPFPAQLTILTLTKPHLGSVFPPRGTIPIKRVKNGFSWFFPPFFPGVTLWKLCVNLSTWPRMLALKWWPTWCQTCPTWGWRGTWTSFM